jgi:hypothetical protein
MQSAPLFIIAFAAIVGGCASSAAPSTSAALQSRIVRSSPNTLTKTELVANDQGRDLYETLRALRPTFLFSQGSAPTVAINGVLVGPTSILRTINVNEVTSVRLLNGLDATTRYGAQHTGAVLLVELRP